MNTPQQPQPTQQMPQAPKKGRGALVGIVVLLIALIAALLFWPKSADVPGDQVPATAQEQQTEDFSSIEAELEATQFEGVSESL